MDPKLLEEIGLTQGETKVYLALIRMGATKTGALAKEAEVSSSKVYKILDRLIKKGLAGHVTKGKTKYYSAMEPKRVLEYMEEKEKSLHEKKELVKKLVPQLELEQKMSGERTEAVIYEGAKAISNFFRNIIDELEPGEEYHVLGAKYSAGLRPFFYNHHTRRAKKGIKLNMLANYEVKESLEPTTYVNARIRFLPQYLITDMGITFYKDKSFIIMWTKSPVGFLIKGEEAVKSFRSYFNALWKIAKA
ncbi:TrmB family transcriptional regulator [Thermoproteota archaeon]